MSKQNPNAIQAAKQPVALKAAIKSCLVPTAIVVSILLFVLYAEVVITENIDYIDQLFTLNIEALNTVLALIYLDIVILASAICICIKYEKASNIKTWVNVCIVSAVLYIVLMVLFANSYWGVETLTAFQSNLAIFIWFPVWLCIIALVGFIMLLVHSQE